MAESATLLSPFILPGGLSPIAVEMPMRIVICRGLASMSDLILHGGWCGG